ncbi:hypothetical protein [Alcaligenes faecalis]|nr:hypothetical protein [Alcaligenes faecalis]
MKTFFSFLLGVREFRSSVTAHLEDVGQSHAYDIGRELAHRLTLRKFEQ